MIPKCYPLTLAPTYIDSIGPCRVYVCAFAVSLTHQFISNFQASYYRNDLTWKREASTSLLYCLSFTRSGFFVKAGFYLYYNLLFCSFYLFIYLLSLHGVLFGCIALNFFKKLTTANSKHSLYTFLIYLFLPIYRPKHKFGINLTINCRDCLIFWTLLTC